MGWLLKPEIEIDAELLSTLKGSTDNKEKFDLVKSYVSRFAEPDRFLIWEALIVDTCLDSRLRSFAIWELGEIHDLRAVRALRLFLHDRTQDTALRLRAMDRLIGLETGLRDVDLSKIMLDREEPIELRERAVETCGEDGTRIVKRILRERSDDPRILFWGVYRLHSELKDDEATELLESYLDDDRVVDISMKPFQKRPATIAMEAAWALDQQKQVYSMEDPEWMVDAE